MRYHYQLDHHHQKKFLRRTSWFLIFVIVCIVGFAGYAYIDNLNESSANTEEKTTSGASAGYFAPAVGIIRSPYFQFQANKSWAQATSDSTGNKFVYRSLRDSLIERELTIYVNGSPSLSATRVLPVNLKGTAEFLPQAVSDHCGKTFPTKQQSIQSVTLDRVNFNCQPDSTAYTVFVGLVGGSTQIALTRPNGQKAMYTIYYSDVTATPSVSHLSEIISTFQAR
ncbi:hypothetical protein A3F37_01795 [Candidatus Saccharibacteria bacterium RIFCSPHIGHO2_12_FULL_41_12]|nr:MAG: hypothetical protein A3F37_01795 [Candidatus Saccharibacteria bacterium RIFCSPHIGHO2_12_FULL_41_12]